WFESIGGHHWMARRVPDDCYVVCPNQQGIDVFDMNDAMGEKRENLCSADLLSFIRDNHLDPDMEEYDGLIGTRAIFGSRSDADHVYNTPRAWYMHRYLVPNACGWDGEDARYRPDSDDLPWCMVPEKKVTLEDIKYVLSSHYQGTKYDPYAQYGDLSESGRFRPIGINRNNFVAVTQLRDYVGSEFMAVEWIACGSNVFNALAPFYANVRRTPGYLADTSKRVTTENFYWENRVIAALADAHFHECHVHVERYENEMMSLGHEHVAKTDRGAVDCPEAVEAYLEKANDEMAQVLKEKTDELLDLVLYDASVQMKNSFSRSDA
ncbi:MAG: C69 family dipeptidase, partial [Eubacteriaceae bacterium]|nr:C69 family dipeptidase [Eubacteriaceae bacterium]